MIGVYSITCIPNGRIYIGSSVIIEERWTEHIRCLNKRSHHNRRLQRSWNKYGATAFQFAVLSLCSREQLLQAEQIFLDVFDSVRTGFNCAPTAGNNLGCKFSPEAIENLKRLRKGRRPKQHTMDAARAGYAAWIKTSEGQEKSKASLEKAHASNRGKKYSAETRQLMSLAARRRHAKPQMFLKGF